MNNAFSSTSDQSQVVPPPHVLMYYITKDGVQQGPYDEANLHAQVASGTLPVDVLVWAEGMATWQPYHQVFAASGPVSPSVPPSDVQPGVKDQNNNLVCKLCDLASRLLLIVKRFGEFSLMTARAGLHKVRKHDWNATLQTLKETLENSKGEAGKQVNKVRSRVIGIGGVVVTVIVAGCVYALCIPSAESEFEKGKELEKKAPQEAFSHFEVAAEKGHAEAQFYLASLYADGEKVPKNNAKAAKWYRKAAEQGHAEAQFRLALCYANGKGVPQSFKETVRWYKKAAEQGDSVAQYHLALCYISGTGVPKDFKEGVRWLRESDNNWNFFGGSRAGELLSEIEKSSKK